MNKVKCLIKSLMHKGLELVCLVVRYSLVVLIVFFLMNANDVSHISNKSTHCLKNLYLDNAQLAFDSFFDICESEISEFFHYSQQLRLVSISNFKKYITVIYQLLKIRGQMNDFCMDKIYKASKNSFGVKLETYYSILKRMMMNNEHDHHIIRIENSLTERKELTESQLNDILEFADQTVAEIDTTVFESFKHSIPLRVQTTIKKQYMTDRIKQEFDVEENDIFESQAFKESESVQKKLLYLYQSFSN